MKRFHYTAVDRQGQPVTGMIDAADWAAAEPLLAARGLVEYRQSGAEDLPALGAAEGAELAGYLAESAGAGLPLGEALRAVGSDASSPALRQAIADLATRLDAGESLDAALTALGSRLPEHVRRLLTSAAASGHAPQTLAHLVELGRSTDDMTVRLRQAVAYPAVLLALLVGWLVFMAVDVAPAMVDALRETYVADDSEPRVPFMYHLEQFSELTPPLVVGMAVAACATLAVVLALGGTAALSRIAAAIPLVGPCWKYRGLADFTALLAEFLEARQPLDEALRLAAGAARDPAIRAACPAAAVHVAGGATLAQALANRGVFPRTLVTWAEWGEAHAALAGAMRTAADDFRGQFELRLDIVRAFVPAIVFGLVAGSVLIVVGGLLQLMGGLVGMLTSVTQWGAASSDLGIMGIVTLSGTLCAAVLGVTLLVVARLMRARGETADAAAGVLWFTAMVVIGISLFVAGLMMAGGWGFVGWLFVVVVWIRGALRYRTMQKQSLWGAMSLSVDKQGPLGPLARAFADEHGGGIGVAARQLATRLDAGEDLAAAASESKSALPADAPLVVRMGTSAGDLTGALHAARGDRGARPLMPASVVWLALYVPASLLIVSFMLIKVLPAYITIIEDYGARLPRSTVFIYSVGDVIVGYWFLLTMAVLLLLLLAWLQWRGTLAPRLPGLARVVRWIDLAPVLRLLALVTRRGRPLPEALATLARLHPKRWVRRRLRRAARDVERGHSWQQSLRRRRLLARNDAALLAAAERTGNLPWALEELGHSYDRRAEFRLRMWNQIALPLLLLGIGLVVGTIAVAFFLPIADLIFYLS